MQGEAARADVEGAESYPEGLAKIMNESAKEFFFLSFSQFSSVQSLGRVRLFATP